MSRVRIRAATGTTYSRPWYAAFPILLPMGLAILGMAGLLLLVQSSGITSAAYEVLELEEVRVEWVRANYQLEAERDALQSLARVEKEALGKFQMVSPDRPLFVPVKRSSTQSPGPDAPRARVAERPPSASPGWSWHQIVEWLRAWF